MRVQPCKPEALLCGLTYIDLVGLNEKAAAETLARQMQATVTGRAKPTSAPTFPGTSVAGRGAGLPRVGRRRSVSVSVLHLSDLRFGGASEHHGGTAPPLAPMLDDLRRLATARPEANRRDPLADLIVVTGNLTATASQDEFDRAHDFLAALADGLDLPRDRIVAVPGDLDVNDALCESYILQERAYRKPAVEPFWPKWEFFANFLRRLHGDEAEARFRLGREWSVVAFPELRVVVAGLNSTMARTHEIRHAELGERQLRAVVEELDSGPWQDWLRLGMVHHAPTGSAEPGVHLRDGAAVEEVLAPRLHLLMHAGDSETDRSSGGLPTIPHGPAESARYQLIDIDATGFTRRARVRGSDAGAPFGADDARSGRVDVPFRPAPETFGPPAAGRRAAGPAPARAGDSEPGVDGSEPGAGVDDRGWPDDLDDGDRWIADRHAVVHRDAVDGIPGDGRARGSWRRILDARPRDTLDELARIRHRETSVERVEAVGEMPAHLRVRRTVGHVVELRLIGLIEQLVDEASVAAFATAIAGPYLAYPFRLTDLVYTGETQASPALVEFALGRQVRLLSMPEYQGCSTCGTTWPSRRTGCAPTGTTRPTPTSRSASAASTAVGRRSATTPWRRCSAGCPPTTRGSS